MPVGLATTAEMTDQNGVAVLLDARGVFSGSHTDDVNGRYTDECQIAPWHRLRFTDRRAYHP